MKPVKPDESECCGSGCKPCIFDVYEERLKKWELKQLEVTECTILNQIKYLPFVITKITHLTDSLRIFEFQAVKQDNHEIIQEALKINSGEYLILKGRDSISRPYTPVLDEEKFKLGSFTVIISLLPNGRMSTFIQELQTNDVVYWRGPYVEFEPHITKEHILLIGAGTGVVPLYNLAKQIIDDEKEVWVNVVGCFRSMNEFILRDEFNKLREFWNFKMNVYVSVFDEDFKSRHNESIEVCRLNETVIQNLILNCGKNEVFVVVCGPEGFNHFVKNVCNQFGVDDENIFVFW